MWEKRRLLVWGKTYPEFSKKYYETVCTGAVDFCTGRLVRLYPITLRYSENPFALYDWIEVDAERNVSDRRPESHRTNQDTIRVVGKVGTEDGWAERSRWVLRDGNAFASLEALLEAQTRDHTSLGLVKPKEIRRIYVRQRPDHEREEWDLQRERALQQRDLFVDAETKTKDLAFMPVQYRAEFTCSGAGCHGHDLSIHDWGMYALSRKQYFKGGPEVAERDVIAKIRERMDPTKRNAHFFLGNAMAHPTSFMIVGFFAPPLTPVAEQSRQTALPF